MTRLFTINYSRPIAGAVSLTVSLLTLLLINQKLELQRVQSERDVAVTQAREYRQAFEKEHKKRALLFMLNKAAPAGKASRTGKGNLHEAEMSHATRPPEIMPSMSPVAMTQSIMPLPHLVN